MAYLIIERHKISQIATFEVKKSSTTNYSPNETLSKFNFTHFFGLG
jgi:hypothetical protein